MPAPDRLSLEEMAAEVQRRMSSKQAVAEGFVQAAERPTMLAALYILGASLSQLAFLEGCSREAVRASIGRRLSPEFRARIRPGGLFKPALAHEELSLYYSVYRNNRADLIQLDPVTVAARLRAITPGLED